jgi:preprotein translocase subunit YajC
MENNIGFVLFIIWLLLNIIFAIIIIKLDIKSDSQETREFIEELYKNNKK